MPYSNAICKKTRRRKHTSKLCNKHTGQVKTPGLLPTVPRDFNRYLISLPFVGGTLARITRKIAKELISRHRCRDNALLYPKRSIMRNDLSTRRACLMSKSSSLITCLTRGWPQRKEQMKLTATMRTTIVQHLLGCQYYLKMR